jgi:hypothetical protein
MKITHIRFYDGAKDKICRLGVAHLFLELQEIILGTHIALLGACRLTLYIFGTVRYERSA